MNIFEAAEFLKNNGIRYLEDENCLETIEDDPEFAYSVEKKGDRYITYHYERGNAREEKAFDNEQEACVHFVAMCMYSRIWNNYISGLPMDLRSGNKQYADSYLLSRGYTSTMYTVCLDMNKEMLEVYNNGRLVTNKDCGTRDILMYEYVRFNILLTVLLRDYSGVTEEMIKVVLAK